MKEQAEKEGLKKKKTKKIVKNEDEEASDSDEEDDSALKVYEEMIFFYLIDEDNKVVSFRKEPLKNFKIKDPPCLKWYQLEADDSTGIISDDYLAGLISMKVSIAYIPEDPEIDVNKFWEGCPGWKEKPPR